MSSWDDTLDQIIGRSEHRTPFTVAELGSPQLEDFLTAEKLAALKYARVWVAEKNTLGYHPLEQPNPWPPKVLQQFLVKSTPLVGPMGAPVAREKFPRVLAVGSRVAARMPDGTPIFLEWGQLSKERYLMFPGLFIGVLRAKQKSIPVREQLSMYRRMPAQREGAGEFECTGLVADGPPLGLAPIKQLEWAGWVGAFFQATENLNAEPGTPAESVWSSYWGELLVKADLSEAVFCGQYDMDASA